MTRDVRAQIKMAESWKESINSDGRKFHQYQQSEQWALIFALNTEKRPGHVRVLLYYLPW
jgi:hypothetical protein